MKKILFFIIVPFLVSGWVTSDPADPISRLRERVDLYNRKYNRVKLDLFFNQPKYAPGDTALVRTLYLSASDLKPVEGAQIIHVELFDSKGLRVFRNQIQVLDGLASNALIIPEDISPGIYLLVAHSDWMQNWDPSLFYTQEFVVTGKELLQNGISKNREKFLNFYPEGGALISGIENNLVVRISGPPKNAKAVIRGDADEIKEVTFDSEGLAEVRITPKQNVHYTAELSVEGQVKRFDLPSSKPDGFSIEASTSPASDVVKVKLRPSSNLDLKKKYFVVLTNSRGIAFSRQLEFNKSEPLEFSLPEDLPPGIAQIMLTDEDLKTWLQRLVMIPNRTDFAVKVVQPKKIYSTREGVKMDIEVVDKSGNPVHGNFAVRITNQNLLDDTLTASTLGDNLLLYSDIPATARLKNAVDKETVNRYLITQSCPWLSWDKIAAANLPAPRYLPSRVISILGKAVFSETGKPLPDSAQIMFFLQRQIFGYEVYTHSKGVFNCPLLFDFFGTEEVFFSASYKGKDLHGVSLLLVNQDSIYRFKANPWTTIEKPDVYGTYQSRKKVIDQSYSFFSKDREKKDSISDPNASIEEELQGADIILTVSDFILFPTMPDLIREVLRSVDYRKIRDKDVIRVYTTNRLPNNFAGPLYVIDGVFTKNPTTFLGLKPADIITIKVVKEGSKLAKFGSLGANGVILVRTKNPDIMPGPRKENTFTLVGMSPKFEPQSDSGRPAQDMSIPVLKPCLYWAPHQKLDSNGKTSLQLTTSDDVGNYKIHIEGLTTGGRPFFAEETFQVKYNRP